MANTMNQKNPHDQSTNSASKPRLEHIAFNVSDPIAAAQWYCENLGMIVMRSGPPPVNVRFIADSAGKIMFELYYNTAAPVLEFGSFNPLCLHIAFMTDDLNAIRDSLIAADAIVIDDSTTIPNGDQILMMRDPWGLSIQFVKRAEPMLK
jgi:catechol 2,3-dioxygenase-like lactoylglutathione lyase family enzyme